MIRDANHADATAVADIYNHYILNTAATFEEKALGVEEIENRIAEVQRSGFSWLVAVEAAKVIGYAYSSRWQPRSAYRYTAEVTVYLAESIRSRGWGTALYTELFSRLRANSIHVAIGAITLPNAASIALHEKFGMEQVAHFKQVGFKFGQWLDVGHWQVELNA